DRRNREREEEEKTRVREAPTSGCASERVPAPVVPFLVDPGLTPGRALLMESFKRRQLLLLWIRGFLSSASLAKSLGDGGFLSSASPDRAPRGEGVLYLASSALFAL
ncbi:hypothetical protein IGI04_013814, partial [Brassica rapa subsp. trilocularis]